MKEEFWEKGRGGVGGEGEWWVRRGEKNERGGYNKKKGEGRERRVG